MGPLIFYSMGFCFNALEGFIVLTYSVFASSLLLILFEFLWPISILIRICTETIVFLFIQYPILYQYHDLTMIVIRVITDTYLS